MNTASPFAERAPNETGFAAFYDERVRPVFRSLKTEEGRARRAGLRTASFVLLAGVLPVAGALWLGFGPMGGAWWPAIVTALVVLFIAGMVLAATSGNIEDSARRQVLPLLVAFCTSPAEGGGLRLVANPADDFVDAGAFGSLRLFADALHPNSIAIKRGIEGQWHGVPFRMAHVVMEHERRSHGDTTRRKTLFSGGLLEVPLEAILDRPLPLTVFCADRDRLGPFSGLADLVKSRSEIAGTTVVPVGTGDPQIDRFYDVYSADPGALPARSIPAFGQALIGIATDIFGEARYLAAVMIDGKLLVALPATDLPHRHERGFLDLRIFNIDEERFTEELHAALEDLTLPRKIIAGLQHLRGDVR